MQEHYDIVSENSSDIVKILQCKNLTDVNDILSPTFGKDNVADNLKDLL